MNRKLFRIGMRTYNAAKWTKTKSKQQKTHNSNNLKVYRQRKATQSLFIAFSRQITNEDPASFSCQTKEVISFIKNISI